jgi:DNA adenine methylase
VKPIVKWVGGKSRLLPELRARMPATFGRYFEPMCGGAALFFDLEPWEATLNDLNADLIETFRAVRDDADEVIIQLHKLIEAASARESEPLDRYDAVRRTFNNRQPNVSRAQRAAAFIYLNKTCFNGLWRVNLNGEFNVPMGRYTNPKILDIDALIAASAALACVELRCEPYQDVTLDAEAEDFVYFDPPYNPASSTSSFTSYNAGGFGIDHQGELADHARSLVRRGCHVMLSNSDTPLIRELYSGFTIDVVQRSGSINSDPEKRGKVNELIITRGKA